MLIFCEILVKLKKYDIIHIEVVLMPATITHNLFGKDVYNSLDEIVKSRIEPSKNIYNIFNMSFDILFFTKPKYGHHAHTHNTNSYFKNIIKYIKDYNLENNSTILAYLYGSICHYVLDTNIHPFIYYKSGQYKGTKETKKYRGKHNYIEYMMDTALYNYKFNKPIHKANFKKEICEKLKDDNELSQIINYTFKNTFDISNASSLFYKGYKNYKFILLHGMASRFGLKKPIYKLIDILNIYPKERLTYHCYYIKKIDNKTLNLKHKKWCYPVGKNKAYHYSFYDLYDIALLKAKDYINAIDKNLRENKPLDDIIASLKNINYCTGIDCNSKKTMQYFEY